MKRNPLKYVIHYLLICALTLNQYSTLVLVTKASGMAALAVSILNSTDVWADAISDKGREGQSFARDQLRHFDFPNSDQATQTMTLYPDTNPTTVDMNEMFPDMVPGTLNDAEASYGNDPQLGITAANAQGALSLGTDTQSRAYQTLFQSINGRPHPNMTTDPVFNKTDDILSGIDPTFLANFQDCSINEGVTNTQEAIHVPDKKTCKRVVNSGQCKVFHNITGHLVNTTQIISSRINLNSTLSGGVWQIAYSSPTFTYNLRTGATSSSFPIRLSSSSFSPLITDTQFDSMCSSGAATSSINSIAIVSPVGCGSQCPSATVLQTPTCANNFVGRIRMNESIFTGTWFNTSYMTWNVVIGAPTKVIDSDEWVWSDSSCQAAVTDQIQDGFCTPTFSCTGQMDALGCVDISSMTVCPTDSVYAGILEPPPPITGIDRLCKEVTIDSTCSFNVGPMDCFTDINGDLQCPTNNSSEPNGCLQYEQDPTCAFIQATCVEGASGPSGQCYAFNEEWDCGFNVNVDNVVVSKTVDCSGPIRCMGTDCTAPVDESSQDFARAVAASKAATMMTMDQDCASQFNCEIFKGEAYECKEAVGGLIDCCEEPSGGPSLTEYMSLISAIGEIDAAVGSMDTLSVAGLDVKGAWDTLSAPVDQVISTATDTFTSAVESITGSTAVGETAVSMGFKQTLVNSTAEWVTTTFGEQAAGTLFTETAAGSGVFQLGGTSAWLGNMISWAFTIYTIYQVVILLINILWSCEQREFELGSKRKLKSCHFVGSYCADDVLGFCVESRDSYCCYNSPLARIFQEQVRPVLGLNFGGAKLPDCSGVTAEQLSGADLSNINLDEYIGILQVTGQMPDLGNYDSVMSLDAITGSGNPLNVTGTRQDTGTRTQNRINQMGNSPDAIREQIRGDLY